MLVLFDQQCPLCRSLAAYMAARAQGHMQFQAWQEFVGERPALFAPAEAPTEGKAVAPAELGVWLEDQLLTGPAAWQALLTHHPDLSHFNWLAAKLGLVPEASQAMQRVGHTIRRLCWRCPASLTPRRRKKR